MCPIPPIISRLAILLSLAWIAGCATTYQWVDKSDCPEKVDLYEKCRVVKP